MASLSLEFMSPLTISYPYDGQYLQRPFCVSIATVLGFGYRGLLIIHSCDLLGDTGTSTFFLKIWEISNLSEILGNFGEIGPNRTREIVCASEMRVTALPRD